MNALEEAVAKGELDPNTKLVFDMGMNRMKAMVRETFEEAIKAKPWMTAIELYEFMKKYEII